jgi:hypothetical protein
VQGTGQARLSPPQEARYPVLPLTALLGVLAMPSMLLGPAPLPTMPPAPAALTGR